MNNLRKVLQHFVIGASFAWPLSCLSAPVERLTDLSVVVAPPHYDFVVGKPLTLDRDAKLAADEFELSQTLGPLLQAGNYDAAYVAITAYKKSPSAALDLLTAQLLSMSGDYTDAIARYQSAITKSPQLMRAHAGLGTLFLVTEQFEPARDSLARAIAYGANDVQTFAQLGYLNQKLSNPWSAINAYQQALMFEPENAQWQFGLLTALVASGHFKSAEALVSEMLVREPGNITLWQQRANLAMQQNDTLRAVASLETATRLGDNNASNRLAVALLHLRLGNMSRAADLLKQNVEGATISVQEAYPIVDWLLNKNATEEAGELIESLRNHADADSSVELSLTTEMQARYAIHRGQVARATDLMADAVNLDPANVRAVLSLGRLYLDDNQLARASIMFERVSVIEGHVKPGLLGRAQVAIARQEYAGALRLVLQIQKQFPGSYELDGYVQSLTSLSTADAGR
ncbi:MAG: tetratricopeptide repeat protein [Pseudomonadota bacterium]